MRSVKRKSSHEIIDAVQVDLNSMQNEFKALSVLFFSLGKANVTAEDLQGIGSLLERAIVRLDKANDQLSLIYSSFE